MTFSALPFWSKDEIEERDDGYILLKDEWNSGEDQPLLLHSTGVVLRFLYPGMDLNAVLTEEGNMGSAEPLSKVKSGSESSLVEMGNQKAKTHAKMKRNADLEPDYEAYQSMDRVIDLSSRLQSAIVDIQRCRHRSEASNEKSSRETEFDDFEQEHDSSVVSQNEASEARAFGRQKNRDEIKTIQLVRTLNSVRALFPHLIPILNHPRRNDKKLIIHDVKWKQRKRKAMCWILGKRVFDTTTVNWCKTARRDITAVLKGYIDVSLAETIVCDPLGSFEFWKTHWLMEVKKRIAPKIMSPLDVLSENKNSDEIMRIARELDQELFSTDTSKRTLETQRRYRQCIDNLRDHILKLLRKRYAKARLSLYGSCLSNLSLGVGSDVDLSLWIPIQDVPKKERKEMAKHVYKVFHLLNNRDGFEGMQPITRARVPVVKGTKLKAGNPYTPDGSIDFDICFLNDIAVANSNLLREYSLMDSRVRDFMLQVKRFCRYHAINSSPSGTISSYAWNVMCIFYLQCILFIPNLQDRKLMEKVSKKPNPKGNYWHRVDDLDTFYLKWSDAEGVWKRPPMYSMTPVSLLLYGFFEFYSVRFPGAFFGISIRHGGLSLSKLSGKVSSFLSIEDPFEVYDSWKPHDLGSHASINGADKIFLCLEGGERYLRELLLGMTTDPDIPWKLPDEGEVQDVENTPALGRPKRDRRATRVPKSQEKDAPNGNAAPSKTRSQRELKKVQHTKTRMCAAPAGIHR
ncbi:unnamed protein product [Cylindrotheca closterium]|uniref:Polynucleotide adenylyltransferase n=1 Tax=Cylindrotheca closterium TaxID=2856 RepID=A0AAD2GCG3_9STRA|nr:unnamed protein product [Cylindrotheca closterium]